MGRSDPLKGVRRKANNQELRGLGLIEHLADADTTYRDVARQAVALMAGDLAYREKVLQWSRDMRCAADLLVAQIWRLSAAEHDAAEKLSNEVAS